MRVRSSLLLVALAMLVAPLIQAQSPGAPRLVAFLTSDATCATKVGFPSLVDAMAALGYREGKEVAFDCRSAEGRYERLGPLAVEIVQRGPAVLVAAGAPASLAAKRATTSIPIVSVYTADPVELGLATSLARPDANVTGISALSSDYAGKSLQLLKEAAPRTARVGVLGHATNATYAIYARELESAAPALGLTLDFAGIVTPDDIEPALANLKRRGADAFLVMNQPFTFGQRARIVAGVAGHQVPAIHGSREAVELGGFASYAANVSRTFTRSAYFVDRILRGAKPADLPFEQPTTFELAVNLRTATALGMTVPQDFLLRADHVVR